VQDADDPFDHAHVDLLLLQRAALLNVQLEVAGDAAGRALSFFERCRISSDEGNAITDGLPALRDDVEQLLIEP